MHFAVDLDQAQARGLTHQDVEDLKQLMKDVVVLALTVRPERRVVVRDQLVGLLMGDVALRPVDMKRARLEAQALRAVRHSTEWLTAAEIADLADLGPANPIATVSRWKQQGRIYALRQGGKDYYPKYALGLGLARADVIDSDPHDYPITRRLSAWLYDNKPDAQGICWMSRQNDEGRAMVLFEPRLGSVKLSVATEDEIFTDEPHLDALLTLAERMGASVIVR